MSFHNPFRLVPVSDVADLGDKLIRNEILTPNEMRGILGFKPSSQEGADTLRNPNMPMQMQMDPYGEAPEGDDMPDEGYEDTNVTEDLPQDDNYAQDEYYDAEQNQNGSESQY